jgi:integrase
MVSTYHAYLLDEYIPVQHLARHEQVLVHTAGRTVGQALSTSAVRKMLRKACTRAGIDGYITPHALRHKAAAALYEASDFNAELVAQEFGWSSPEMVTGLYGRSAHRQATGHLKQAWGATARPASEPYLALPTEMGADREPG